MAGNSKRWGFRKPVLRLDIHTHLGELGNPGGCLTVEERIAVDAMLGIDHSVILPYPVNPGDPNSEGMFTTEKAQAVAEKYPGHFSWFCNIAPDGTEQTAEKLREYKAAGALGVGEFGTLLPFDDPKVDHLLSCCEEQGMPFLFHISPGGTNRYGVIDHPGLPLLEKALERHPGVPFIAHSQPFWYELGVYDSALPEAALNGFPFGRVTREGRAVELLRKYPNLYADLSATSGSNAILRDPEFGVRFLEEFQDRLFFGTDLVDTKVIFPLGQMLDYYLLSGRIGEAVYRKVCRENAEKLLGIGTNEAGQVNGCGKASQ